MGRFNRTLLKKMEELENLVAIEARLVQQEREARSILILSTFALVLGLAYGWAMSWHPHGTCSAIEAQPPFPSGQALPPHNG